LLVVFALYALVIYRGLRAALRSVREGDAHLFFLALGLTLLIALQVALIGGGVLGLAPLSGVVSPFLSSGRSAMIANLAIIAVLLVISACLGEPESDGPFRRQVKWLSGLLVVLLLCFLGKASYVQLYRADETLNASVLTLNQNGDLNFF